VSPRSVRWPETHGLLAIASGLAVIAYCEKGFEVSRRADTACALFALALYYAPIRGRLMTAPQRLIRTQD